MKKATLITLFALCFLTLSATENNMEDVPDNEGSVFYDDGSSYSIVFSWDKKKKKHSKKLSPHWSGFGMGFMNYDDSKIPNGSLKMSSSHNFTFNIMTYSKQIKHSNWLFVSGLGLDWLRYHFNDNAALTKENGITVFKQAPDGVNYKSTKLLSYYVTVPLLLEYQTGDFHISGGIVGFLKYYSKSQVKYYDEKGKHKDNMGRDLNICPIDMKLRLQAGINDVNIFGYYSPFSMFKNDKGPELRTYTIGVFINM